MLQERKPVSGRLQCFQAPALVPVQEMRRLLAHGTEVKKYLFIDRDGTLIAEPADYQVDALSKVAFEPMVIPALLRLKQAGYTFVMVSNQDGLGTASFPLEDFTGPHELVLNTLSSQGITFEEVLICPHKPEDHCSCRKPELGLVMAYLKDTSWDREHSYFIGDRDTDLKMAENMGITGLRYNRDGDAKSAFSWEQLADLLTRRERVAHAHRKTKETDVEVSVDLDHSGNNSFDTGVGFFNHMLDQIAVHGGFSMQVKVKGDLEVDAHHTIEDTGIVIGQVLKEALLDKRGIRRFGFVLPMDEVRAEVFAEHAQTDPADTTAVALDISGRPYAVLDFAGTFTEPMVGDFPSQMTEHFFTSLATAMGLTLHMQVTKGNCHHQIEALFKAFGRALRQAISISGNELPSSKGSL